MNYKLSKSLKRNDRRGSLVDFLAGTEMLPTDKGLGQIYFVTFEKKNTIRGNHYHTKKKEWFVVVRGKLKVLIEDVKTKKRKEFILNGDEDEYIKVFVDENIAHAFKNLTKRAEMINYCNKSYNPKKPDTIFYKLF